MDDLLRSIRVRGYLVTVVLLANVERSRGQCCDSKGWSYDDVGM